jgi:hypothetical protein
MKFNDVEFGDDEIAEMFHVKESGDSVDKRQRRIREIC